MTTKKKSKSFEFVVQELERDNDADYATIKAAAEAAGYTIYPIVYGRAKAKLGLVDVKPRGANKRTAERREPAASHFEPPATRRPTYASGGSTARSPSTASSTLSGPMGSLETVIQAMKDGEAERHRYRAALEQIQHILEDVLARD